MDAFLRGNRGHAYLLAEKAEAIVEYKMFIGAVKENPMGILRDDFSSLKKMYPAKIALINWAEEQLGVPKTNDE